MRTLWISFLHNSTVVNHNDEAHYQSGGCKLSKRHLRRRTGSHNRRKRHRFPTGASSGELEKKVAPGEMSKEEEEGEKEEEEDVVSRCLCEEKDEDKHNKYDDDDNNNKKQEKKNVKEMSRRAKRKPALLRMKNGQWKNIHDKEQEEEAKEKEKRATGGGNTNWLETHLWHSKRFYMSPPLSIYNNWCIPLGHTNRGSRAAIRLSKSKSTIQDATWSISGKCIIVKTAKQEDLIRVIEKVCGGNRLVSAPFLMKDGVIKGLEVGYGNIYSVKSTFPSGLLAPAFFMFGQENSKSQWYFVRIFIQAGSVVDQVETMVKEVVTEDMVDVHGHDDSSFHLTKEAMCWIRVRGVEATSAIRKSLQMESEDEKINQLWKLSDDNYDDVTSSRHFHTMLPHGTIMRMTYKYIKQQNHHQQKEMNRDAAEFKDCEIDDVVDGMLNRNHFELTDTILEDDGILLISQMPCPVDSTLMHHNHAVSGWDILCKPSQTCRIFSALNNVGGACAIGFIEDAAMKLEAEPPLPVWPRDYPDVLAGQEYWSGDHEEWRLLRYCIEQGMAGGRLKTGLRRLLNSCRTSKEISEKEQKPTSISRKLIQRQIDWAGLSFGSGDTIQGTDVTRVDLKQQHPVIVRGTLNTPFVQALCGFGNHYFDTVYQNTSESGEENVKRRNRPRRKVRGKDTSVILPPLDEELLQEHQTFCSKLLKSLTLPALLRCHLVAEGKGNIKPGMIIGMNTTQKDINATINTIQTLGYVVSGGFSQNRGRVHGVGIVSAKTFLSILSGSAYTGRLLVVSRENQKKVGLKVILQSHDDDKGIMIQSIFASLTILLQ